MRDEGGCLWVQVCDGCWRCSWQEGSPCCKCSSNRNPWLTQSRCFLQSNLFLYSRWTICVSYSQVWIFFAGLHIKNENVVLRTVRPELKFFRSSWVLLITSSLTFTSFANAKSLGACALFVYAGIVLTGLNYDPTPMPRSFKLILPGLGRLPPGSQVKGVCLP